jgi:hypothetical protein
MDIGGLVNRSWQRFSADIGMNIGVFVVGILAAAVIGGLTLGILGIPIVAGLYKVYRTVARGGRAEFGELFSEMSNIGKWFMLWLAMLVLGVALFIVQLVLNFIPFLGQIASVALSFAVAYLLAFVFPLMLERGLAAIDAIKQSIQDTTGNVGRLLGPLVVAWLIYMAGSLLLGIGVLITGPLAMIMMWLIFDEFYGAGAVAAYGSPTTAPFTTSTETVAPPPPPPGDTTY